MGLSQHIESPSAKKLNHRRKSVIETLRTSQLPQRITWKFFSLIALLLFGAGVGIYGVLFGEHAVLLLGAPLVIPMGALLLISPRSLFFILIASRCALDPILESGRFTSSFGLGGILNILLILCAFWLCVQNSKVSIRQSLLLWVAPLLVMILGVLYSPDIIAALKRLIAFASYFAVFIVGFILVQEGYLKKLLRIIVLSSVIPLSVGFYQLATGTLTIDGRLSATFTHPNIYAFYCMLVLIVLLYLQRTQANEENRSTSSFDLVTQWILLPCLLMSIILTQTRSAWVALIVIGFFYGVLFSRKTLLFMALAVAVAALVPAVQDRVMDLFSGNEVVQYAKLNSFAWRQYIWESGLNWMSPSRYLLGYGTGGFYYYSTDFFPMSGGYHFGAHNVFVERFFDGGLVAVGIFSVFFVTQLIAAYKLLHKDQFTALVYFALILSYLVLSTSDNVIDYLSYNWYYWVVAGAMYANAQRAILNSTTS